VTRRPVERYAVDASASPALIEEMIERARAIFEHAYPRGK